MTGPIFASKYRLGVRLGEGGMGTVFEADELATGRKVALKVLRSHLSSDRTIRKRFDREAEIVRRLSGPNLVSIVDFGAAEDGSLFMALELVQGETLSARVARGPLTPVLAIDVACGILSALEVAHALEIVHRDLKPGNVLLEPRDDPSAPPIARVCDFGVAKALAEAGFAQTRLTDASMVFGTPDYMAPEQVKGEDVDKRADLYAAGCVLYEMLVGSPPFLRKTSVATMTAHVTDAPEPPSRAAKTLAPFDDIVLRALEKDRSLRYPTARDMRLALLAVREAILGQARTIPSLKSPTTRARSAPRISVRTRSPVTQRTPQRQTLVWLAVLVGGITVGVAVGLALSR